MSDGGLAALYLDEFRARGEAIADACTRCGDCFRACPMVGPAGIGAADANETTAAIVDLITGGAGNEQAIRWASVCSGSGNCIPACNYGINPRFMVQLARGFARAQAGDKPLNTRWRQPFQGMSRGVRILSRLQMPPETLARLRGLDTPPRQSPPDVVFYTGCNILKTPHIALLCLDTLDLLGVDYEVMGGPGQCCGVYQSIDGLATAGTSTVLSWCPSCQLQIGEVALPSYESQFGMRPFVAKPTRAVLAKSPSRNCRRSNGSWSLASWPRSPMPGLRPWPRSTTLATASCATPGRAAALRSSTSWRFSAPASALKARTSTSA
jgi:heterodisulfide reductase subunit D